MRDVISKIKVLEDLIFSGYSVLFMIFLYLFFSTLLFLLCRKAKIEYAWFSYLPFVNWVPFFWLVKKNPWKFFLLLLPVVNLILPITWIAELLRSFDRNIMFVILMIFIPGFFIFYIIYMLYSKKVQYVY